MNENRWATRALLVLALGGRLWCSDVTVANLTVTFKLDPRLVSGVYGGERWVSPPTYTTTQTAVDVRIQGSDARGASVHVSGEWTSADPDVATVSPAQGERVAITIKRPGQTTVRVHAQNLFKELAIKAEAKGESMQVEITQTGSGRTAEDAARDARTLQTQKEKLSYALGANLGNGLSRESIEVEPDLIIQGLRDALAGKSLLLSQHEVSVTVAGLKTELMSKRVTSAAEKIKAKKELAEKNKKEGDTFLAENRTKPGVVALESGLQYKVLKAGDGKKPAAGDTVVCQYRGTLLDGTEFASSYTRGEASEFALRQVIPGWREALQLMPAGSKWQLFIPSALAYGARGAANVGPNATLVYELELVEIKDGSGQATHAAHSRGAAEAGAAARP